MALRKHLEQESPANLQAALRLGRRAVALGVGTLKLALVHEQALATLELPSGNLGLRQRAEKFFIQANTPIENNHRASRQTQVRLSRLEATLGQRTKQLATSNRQLKRGAVRRKITADAFAKSGKQHNHCLAESIQLQKRLRQLTHKVMAAQEDERQKISHELQDEIAQTLLGINVRLFSLKQHTWNNPEGLKNQIASTQRLVARSAQAVRRFALELGNHQAKFSVGP